ncbi:MAG: hypothetical protein ACLP2J_00775, partial [Acidimicrobiales bacterium]
MRRTIGTVLVSTLALTSSILLAAGPSQASTAPRATAGAETSATAPHTVVPAAWSIVPSANVSGYDALAGVSCVSASFCMAVGPGPESSGKPLLIEQWNGTVWSVLPSPPTPSLAYLTAVSCTTTSFCVAVGGSPGASFIEQWNGSSWTLAPSPTADQLAGVSCVSTTFCMAVGDTVGATGARTAALQWNGSQWSAVSSPDASPSDYETLGSVVCKSPSWCVAVGYADQGGMHAQTLIEAWNGSAWSIQPSPDQPGASHSYLFGVSCPSAKFCVAVG